MDFSLDSFINLIWNAITLRYWIGEPHPMWYISFILVLYVIYPFYFRHFKNYGLKVPILFILGGFVVMCIYTYVAVFLFDNKKIGGTTFFLMQEFLSFLLVLYSVIGPSRNVTLN